MAATIQTPADICKYFDSKGISHFTAGRGTMGIPCNANLILWMNLVDAESRALQPESTDRLAHFKIFATPYTADLSQQGKLLMIANALNQKYVPKLLVEVEDDRCALVVARLEEVVEDYPVSLFEQDFQNVLAIANAIQKDPGQIGL